MRGSPAGGGYSTLEDLLRFTRAVRAGTLLKAETRARGFGELGPDAEGRVGLGIGGGAPGLNAAVEISGPYTIIVMANLDPPAAERASSQLRRWLLGGGGGERRVMRAGTMAGESPERITIPERGAEVEMTRSGHLPAVQVMINGQGPFRFAIDTGAGGSARLDSALAARLGLETVGQVRSGDPSGRNTRMMNLVRLASVEIGGARFEGLNAAVRDYNEGRMGEPIDGILGFALFKECLFTLDYPGNRLKIERGALPPADGRQVIAFSADRGIPAIRLQVDSLWVNADVDAGSPGGFTLPASYSSRLPLAGAPRVVGRARTVSNEFEITAAELKGSVRLGGFDFPGVTIGFQPVFPVGNVGSGVLKDFRVTFDQKNGRMRLVRGA
jgi:hypothetical protein